MRIAQVAPLWETIPPRSYGGTELVVHLLTEELIRQGHEVTLFASGGSYTEGQLETCAEEPLRELSKNFENLSHFNGDDLSVYPGSSISTYYELRLWEKVLCQADKFDIIHNHLGFLSLPFASLIKTPIITTLHGELSFKTARQIVERKFIENYTHLSFVSISNNQRLPFPDLNYIATVYHGLDLTRYAPSYSSKNKDYMVFLGRFSPDKGAHHAIKIAKETESNLILAGKVDCYEERSYFCEQIEPFIDGKRIKYVGELNHVQKVEILRNAAATLCPVTWREPFGLVLIESMACGTPVLSLRNGSIPEIVKDGLTGFIADSVEELIGMVPGIKTIDRKICHQYVIKNFSVQKMTYKYLQIYEQLIEKEKKQCYPMPKPEKTASSLIGNKINTP